MQQVNLAGMSLNELVEYSQNEQVQKSQAQKQQILQHILTHEQVKNALKNQAHILRKIFTYSRVQLLISCLKQQNPQHAQLLKQTKYDPTGQEIPIYLKLPFKAMQILSSQCHIINDILFTGEGESLPPLLPQLLDFLDRVPHYHLASYFSRVMCAVTKRVSSATHKYNQIFCEWIFGQKDNQDSIETSALFKTINHLYSLAMIDCIMKWLPITSKVKVKQEDSKQQNIIIDRKSIKNRFILKVLQTINKNKLSSDIIDNIPSLFEQLFNHIEKSNKLASTMMIKSMPSTRTGVSPLYQLAASEIVIQKIVQAPQEGTLTLAKIKLVKVFVLRYKNQLQILQKQNRQQQEGLELLQIVNPQHFNTVVDWICQHLKLILKVKTSDEASSDDNTLLENSRIVLSSPQKMLVLHLLQLLTIIQTLTTYQDQVIEFYNANSNEQVELIRRLMALDNNLIQLQTSKLIIFLLKGNQKQKKEMSIPLHFANKLLTKSVVPLMELDSAKSHVIQWADLILVLQNQHIFQNQQEQCEWDHIREIIKQAKSIQIGKYRYMQSNLDHCFSKEKAMSKYFQFLHEFQTQIIYEDKKQIKNQILLKKKSSQDVQILIQETSNIQIIDEIDQEPLEITFLDYAKNNYLQYNFNQLMEQL